MSFSKLYDRLSLPDSARQTIRKSQGARLNRHPKMTMSGSRFCCRRDRLRIDGAFLGIMRISNTSYNILVVRSTLHPFLSIRFFIDQPLLAFPPPPLQRPL